MLNNIESVKELKSICQSQKRDKNILLYTGYLIHRNISIYITRFILVFFPKMKPNVVSFLMLFFSLVGCLFLYFKDFSCFGYLGIFFVYFGFLLDKVDGEIARYKNEYSLRGIYLDELYHLLVPGLLLFSFFEGMMFQRETGILLLFAILLTVLNRINRKLCNSIFVKQASGAYSFLDYKNSKILQKILNIPVFKIFGIVERFDLLIVSLLVLLFVKGFYLAFDGYYLVVYVFFNLFYFIRWSFLNYFGNVDCEVSRIRNNVYKK